MFSAVAIVGNTPNSSRATFCFVYFQDKKRKIRLKKALAYKIAGMETGDDKLRVQFFVTSSILYFVYIGQ